MLTDLRIQKLPIPAKRDEVPDGKNGLYLVVQPSGAKSWAVRYRANGAPKKLTIGPYPAVSLAAARRRAQEALGEVAGGRETPPRPNRRPGPPQGPSARRTSTASTAWLSNSSNDTQSPRRATGARPSAYSSTKSSAGGRTGACRRSHAHTCTKCWIRSSTAARRSGRTGSLRSSERCADGPFRAGSSIGALAKG
jgi:hypothetical protein